MREIEILVKVLESRKSALKKLSKFKIDHISNITDQYYYHPSRKGLLPSKERNSSEMLRTRIKDGKSYMTYKKDVFTKTGWAYSDEHETRVENAGIVDEILLGLDFKPLVKVVNKRTIYYYKIFEICLEEVKGLGLFLEIECIKPGKRDSESIRQEIIGLIKDIGIKVSEESKMGKGELLYRKEHKIISN
jgi:adenylate cyclase class 2